MAAGLRLPRCSHGIFLLAIIYASISIGTLESDSLSLSTPRRTKWILIYLLLYSTILREDTNTGLECWTGLLEWPAGLAYFDFNFMLFFYILYYRVVLFLLKTNDFLS